MQHLEVSGAVRHIYIYIYIYVIRRLKVKLKSRCSHHGVWSKTGHNTSVRAKHRDLNLLKQQSLYYWCLGLCCDANCVPVSKDGVTSQKPSNASHWNWRAWLGTEAGGILRSECGGTRWRTGGEVKGKLANGVGSQYSHTASGRSVSIITNAAAHTSAASSRLNRLPRRFKWTRPFRRKTKSGFCACAIRFRTSSTSNRGWSRSIAAVWIFQITGGASNSNCQYH